MVGEFSDDRSAQIKSLTRPSSHLHGGAEWKLPRRSKRGLDVAGLPSNESWRVGNTAGP
jgi:hypothetical protein